MIFGRLTMCNDQESSKYTSVNNLKELTLYQSNINSNACSFSIFLFYLILTADMLILHYTVCRNVLDFNNRNLCINFKLYGQGFRYHTSLKTFT